MCNHLLYQSLALTSEVIIDQAINGMKKELPEMAFQTPGKSFKSFP